MQENEEAQAGDRSESDRAIQSHRPHYYHYQGAPIPLYYVCNLFRVGKTTEIRQTHVLHGVKKTHPLNVIKGTDACPHERKHILVSRMGHVHSFFFPGSHCTSSTTRGSGVGSSMVSCPCRIMSSSSCRHLPRVYVFFPYFHQKLPMALDFMFCGVD